MYVSVVAKNKWALEETKGFQIDGVTGIVNNRLVCAKGKETGRSSDRNENGFQVRLNSVEDRVRRRRKGRRYTQVTMAYGQRALGSGQYYSTALKGMSDPMLC